MTDRVYVRVRPGGRVRMPDRKFRPMAAEGAWVPRVDFYERLIITEDLVVGDPPAAAAAPTEPANADAPTAQPAKES